MTFPRPDEDKIVLNIVWGYFGGLITKEKMVELLDMKDHSFKHLFDDTSHNQNYINQKEKR